MTNENGHKKFNKAVCAAVHTVEAGETLYGISQKYGVDYRRLMMLNGIKNPNNIFAGQEICIPRNTVPNYNTPAGDPGVQQPSPKPNDPVKYPNPACITDRPQRFHIIAPGDTLYGISRQYGVRLSQLMMCNPEIDPYNLQIGTRLTIPAAPAAPMPHETNSVQSEQNSSSDQTNTPLAYNSENTDLPQQQTASNPSTAEPSSIADNNIHQTTSNFTSDSDGIIYTVSDGETLTALLTRFDICLNALMHENPGVDFTGELAGITLCIPYEDIFRHSPENQPYTVRSGDTLMLISENNATNSDELLRLNPCRNALDFSILGTKIRI